MKADFAEKDVHGRLACWLEFLTEYESNLEYGKGTENKAADFTFHIQHRDVFEEGVDERNIF